MMSVLFFGWTRHDLTNSFLKLWIKVLYLKSCALFIKFSVMMLNESLLWFKIDRLFMVLNWVSMKAIEKNGYNFKTRVSKTCCLSNAQYVDSQDFRGL